MFVNNIVAECSGSEAVTLRSGTIQSDCNVFWSNPDGDVENFSFGPSDRVIDPRFCGSPNGDLSVRSDSPCLPGRSAGCGLIGAREEGCGPVSIETESWGRLKDRYRGEE